MDECCCFYLPALATLKPHATGLAPQATEQVCLRCVVFLVACTLRDICDDKIIPSFVWSPQWLMKLIFLHLRCHTVLDYCTLCWLCACYFNFALSTVSGCCRSGPSITGSHGYRGTLHWWRTLCSYLSIVLLVGCFWWDDGRYITEGKYWWTYVRVCWSCDHHHSCKTLPGCSHRRGRKYVAAQSLLPVMIKVIPVWVYSNMLITLYWGLLSLLLSVWYQQFKLLLFYFQHHFVLSYSLFSPCIERQEGSRGTDLNRRNKKLSTALHLSGNEPTIFLQSVYVYLSVACDDQSFLPVWVLLIHAECSDALRCLCVIGVCVLSVPCRVSTVPVLLVSWHWIYQEIPLKLSQVSLWAGCYLGG